MTWLRKPWVGPLAFVVVAFVAFSLPPYLTGDRLQARVQSDWGPHYPLLVMHVVCASVAILTCVVQIWPWFRARFPAWHRRVGRVYVLAGVLPAGVSGLVIGWMTPLVVRVCEKSPASSSAVGMLARVIVDGLASSVYSCEPKKYSLRPPPLPRLSTSQGITTGPPTLNPEMLMR